jgi:phosphoribosylformimino-5-aminoimidazole carboxamide ribotide isomerase
MRIIPAIDLQRGRCVRLLHGEFDNVTHYEADPVELAASYRDAGASWLHVVDLDGARDGAPVNDGVIRKLASLPGLSVQVGGGIRNESTMEAALDRGLGRVVLGSVAMVRPRSAADWIARHGPERVVLALDVRLDAFRVPRLASHGWTRQTDQSLWQALEYFSKVGLRHMLCTDIGRDGAMTGPNLELYRECRQRFPGIQLQASGGVRDLEDLRALQDAGVQSAIVGKALLDGKIQLEEISQFSQRG